ncbi:hypothetical protein PACTADRAFT_1596 [Pachysolen tannophilus NRRL Y-2460]|uniref:Ecm19p n=1 Tax=Pachysolen tannophilus NRRL Y-2460 TaxID=669874 RepID=A0A1E4TZ53_PACTA|nr:hypothetical protein PACTADRAFT_1596 [Pachysolen tannophilus NRRL Y-2460]
MGLKRHQILTLGFVTCLGIYTGVKFFEPIVIEQLRKDGNLRSDIPIPNYDADGNLIIPKEIGDNLGEGSKWDQVRKQNEQDNSDGRNES